MNAFQRKYANEVRRCEELERILRFFEEQLRKSTVKKSLLKEKYIENLHTGSLDALEEKFTKYEQEIKQLNSSLDDLLKQKAASQEFEHVITKCAKYIRAENAQHIDDEMSEVSTGSGSEATETPLLKPHDDEKPATLSPLTSQGGLGFLTGVISREKVRELFIADFLGEHFYVACVSCYAGKCLSKI